MSIKEFYEDYLGGGYDGAISRFRDETRLGKYLRLFAKDESMSSLSKALADQDWSSAFRAAHTLKGLALNMEFSAFAAAASALTEQLRPCDRAPEQEACDAVKLEYQRVLDGLALLEG